MPRFKSLSRGWINVLDAGNKDFTLQSLAWSLAHQFRYNGNCKHMITVAEHCVLGSYCFENITLAKSFLLHDATELFVSDIPFSVKNDWTDIGTWEEYLYSTKIAPRWKLPDPIPEAVKQMDEEIRKLEECYVFDGQRSWAAQGWSPEKAYMTFLNRAGDLGLK